MLSWLPENISTFGPQIDRLFYVVHYIVTVTFVLVMAVFVWCLIMYRHREGRRATYTHGNTTLEIAWTIAPALILVFLGLASKSIWDEVKENIPVGDVQVMVTGKQFNWEIVYPGPDGKFATEDDLQIDNDLHVPINKKVRINLGAKDVIHSFFVPQLRLKQDALPGRTIGMWFEATKAGIYEIPCAELCGFGHSGMKGRLIVHDAAGYDAWQKEQWPARVQLDTSDSKRG